jgi:aryl-alcohol dehydrogenase-like predicted oxidoreductase
METIDIAGGARVSRIAFGGAPMGGYDYGPVDESELIASVHRALDAGMNVFDVADIYGFGRAEEILGRALAGRRDAAFIATKFGLRRGETGVVRDASAKWIREAVDASLQRLGTDRIDLYQLHWPDPATPLEETASALRDCIEAGKVRLVGCSNVSLDQLQALHALIPVASVQVAFNLLCRDAECELVPWCAANGVAVLAHSPLARGLLAGKRAIGSRFEGHDTRGTSGYFAPANRERKFELLAGIQAIANAHGCSDANVAVRWVLEQPGVACALAGIKNRDQLDDHVRAGSLALLPDEIARLTALSAGIPGVMTGDLARAVEPVYSEERP